MDSIPRSDIISEKAIEETFDLYSEQIGKKVHWQVVISNWLSLGALGCFAGGILAVITMLVYAWAHGLFPNPRALPVYNDNAGPWSSDPILDDSDLTFRIFTLLPYSFALSILSLLFKLNGRAWWLMSLSMLFSFMILMLFIFLSGA